MQNSPIYPISWKKEYYEEKPQYVPFEDTIMPVMQYARSWIRDTYGDDWYFIPEVTHRTGHNGIWTTDFPAAITKKTYAGYLNVKCILENRRLAKNLHLKIVKHEDVIRKTNSIKMALADRFLIERMISNEDIDLKKELESERYEKILGVFQLYLEKQFQKRYTLDQIPISIDKELVLVVCTALTMCGKYYKAQKIINFNFKSKEQIPESFNELINLIDLSRELSVSVYDEENLEKAESLINNYSKQYPHHIDFCVVKFSQKFKRCKKRRSFLELQSAILLELEYHPHSSRLKKLLADIQLFLGKSNDAYKNYREAFFSTKNGMLKLEILDIAKKHHAVLPKQLFSPILQPSISAIDKWQCVESVAVQKKIYQLLKELDDICLKGNIPYFLGGYLAAGAVQNQNFFPGCCTAYVVMHPKDRKAFLKTAKECIKAHRKVESFESNSNYPDFSIRYTDSSSLFFDLREEGFYQYPGVAVTIYFVRQTSKSSKVEKFRSGLYAAIEGTAFGNPFYNHSWKKIAAGVCGKCMTIVLGKRFSKHIAWNLIYSHEKSSETKPGSIKSYWFKKIPIPQLDFTQRKLCEIDGLLLPIPINYNDYIRYQIKPVTANDSVGMRVGMPYVVDTNLNCETYRKALAALKIKRKYFKAAGKVSRTTPLIVAHEKYLYQAWNITRRGLDYIILWKKYMPKKQLILDLYRKNDIEPLREILSCYIDKIKYYSQFDLGIAFDNDILRITCDLMDREGESALIERLLPKIPKAYFQKIKLICGRITKMKKAAEHEKEKILEYLEKDIANCLYLYADIAKYGVSNDHVAVWYDTDEIGIRMVVLKYHNNFQIYSDRGFLEISGLLKLISQEKPISIAGRTEIIRCLQNKLKNNYMAEYGTVFKGKPIDIKKLTNELEDCPVKIELATTEDAPQIAHLLYMDEEL